MVLLYKTDKFTGQIKSSDEGEVYWIDKNDLAGMKIAHDMDALLRVFLDDDLSEFRYEKENGEWKYILK